MKKIWMITAVITFALLSFRTVRQPEWKLDGFHSQLGFTVNLFSVSELKGSIRIKESMIMAPKDNDFTGATVTLVADMETIDTDNDDRDKHLKTAEYFDVAKYPTATFRSTAFEKLSDTRYRITGDLSMHGITKKVVLDAVIKSTKHPVTGANISGFKVSGIIKRSDYGISATTPSAILGDDVAIEANMQYYQEK